jgi:hypothetical protein
VGRSSQSASALASGTILVNFNILFEKNFLLLLLLFHSKRLHPYSD